MKKLLLAFNLAVAGGMGALLVDAMPGVASAAPAQSSQGAPSFSSLATADVSGAAVVQFAMKFLGYPYTTTGNSPSTGFSCIGFASYVYRSLGVNLPGDLGGAMAFAPAVSFSNLQPGDLLFFQNTIWTGLSHVAIYIGGGRFIHAEWYNRGVVTSSFTNDPVDFNYWTAHYLGANRPWTGTVASTVPAAPPTPQPTAISDGVAIPTPIPTHTAPQAPAGPTAVVTVSSLNVRAAPSIGAAIRTTVSRGTRVVLLGHEQSWYHVTLPSGAVGWVIGAGIGKGSASGTVERAGGTPGTYRHPRHRHTRPLVTRPATTTVNIQSPTSIQSRGTAVVQVSTLRVHAAPALRAQVIGTVARGRRVGVARLSAGWTEVILPSAALGWVSSRYLQVGSVEQVGAPKAVVHRNLRTQSTANVTINVRRGPSLGASIVTILPPGGAYQALGHSVGWVHVRLTGNRTGWVSGLLLGSGVTLTARQPKLVAAIKRTSSRVRGSIATVSVRVHAGPNLNSTAVGLIAATTPVKVLSSTAGWTKVRLSKRQVGYVLTVYLKK